MNKLQDIHDESDSLKKLQRALFYEAQFRNAILSDAMSFYDVNITRDLIENDFFFRDSNNDFVSVPDFIGMTTPCKFSDFLKTWADLMIPDTTQKSLENFQNLRNTLINVFNEGRREYVIDYWGEDVTGKRVFFDNRFLLTKNEADEICALSIIKDYTHIHEMDDAYMKTELEMYAYSDPLTKGYNYIKFKEKLKEKQQSGSIICLDIHSFKIINSICGIAKGDDVIKAIWENLRIFLDFENDELAAHINADHFIIFTPKTNRDDIIRLLKNISLGLIVISIDLDIPQLQPYFGVTSWSTGKKIEMAYNEAISAKHDAREKQNIDYSFFNEEDTKRLIREKEMIDSFEDAMARKEFKVFFQPKYSPKNKELVGAEALVRWIKKDGSITNPGDFIPIFERNNIIRKLDEYIFRNVCLYLKKWKDSGKKIVPVSVNLSRASLYYKGVTEEYKRITEIIGVDSKMLPIEITESAAVADSAVKEIIDSFHALGFSLQMDDFGSGYSSLASLNLMHFDTLKLDKSLVDYIGEFGGNRLIEHTISLAKELGIQITAEGVENENQVKFLKNIGCDSIQGFFYSKPVPAEDFIQTLDNPVFDMVKSDTDYVEEHLYNFNQSYYRPSFHSVVINLTKNDITDYYEYADWENMLRVKTRKFTDAVEKTAERYVTTEFQERFKKFLSREDILKDESLLSQIKAGEFNCILNETLTRLRLIVHTFKVPNSDDIWMYVKIFALD